ncbi:uncharacterized protein LOC129615234 [Condylostylus longicornis]|uniref:uncharacterized protein LOC129615234 n=1 Tax=Condylostylus longicornis TaxID=2530218 RepID=UPI00244E1427|nr:uncharacterized protein LOC129615234 [Condylostylus longicornis]
MTTTPSSNSDIESIINNEDYQLDPETAWLEDITIGGFRVWHIMSFCFATLLSSIIIMCCCFRFRIPRTKQEIEADYQRKQLAKKFREKLSHIKNADMDEMDLPKALQVVQSEFLSTENSLENLSSRDDSKITAIQMLS